MSRRGGKDFLKVAVEEWVPWTKVTDNGEGDVQIQGPMANLLQILATLLNFEYKLVRPVDRIWGGPLPNGSWTGLLGMVLREEVEFAVGPFGVTDLRETVCDFSDPLYSENNAILMARPPVQSDMAGFIKTFSIEVWLLMLASLLAVVGVMVGISASEDRIFNDPSTSHISHAALWGLKALMQESSTWLPARDGSRVLVTTWLLASLVFMSSYSGILTAMLTVPRVTIPIDSLQDMVSQSKLPWRLEEGSMMYQYFKEAEDGVRREVFQGISGTFKDCWAARENIARGDFAAICDKTTMKKAMSWDFSTSGQCHLYISRELVYSNAIIAMAFKINSTYRAKANQMRSLSPSIFTVKESGLLNKWLDYEITNTTQCLRPPSAVPTRGIMALDLEAFLGPLLMLGGGMTLSGIAFLVEVVTKCCK